MLLKSVLQLLNQVSVRQDKKMPAMIVGGIPRDKVAGQASKINDVDITTGNNTQHLAKEFSIELHKHIPLLTKQADDGHISIYMSGLKIDFSSNFNIPNIAKILHSQGITPTPLMRETYSRDFFCNTLLMSLDLRKITDITHQAIPDIKNKIIRTCLTPDLTFKYNTNRIIRTIYLAAKLDFNVEPQIIEWIKKNPQYLKQSETSYISKNLEKAAKYDPDKTSYLLEKMELWDHIPITSGIYELYNKRTVREYVGR